MGYHRDKNRYRVPPMKTVIEGVAGLQKLVGKELDPSDWKTLTFDNIKAFADATGDHQWIHVDRERIKQESPFKAPIAHGYYTLSRVAGMSLEMMEMKGVKGAINYGINKLRYPSPLKEGAQYRLKMGLESMTEVPGGVECVFKATMEIKDEPKPALVAEVVYRYFI
jgi:acyl dehydratase